MKTDYFKIVQGSYRIINYQGEYRRSGRGVIISQKSITWWEFLKKNKYKSFVQIILKNLSCGEIFSITLYFLFWPKNLFLNHQIFVSFFLNLLILLCVDRYLIHLIPKVILTAHILVKWILQIAFFMSFFVLFLLCFFFCYKIIWVSFS